MRVLKKGSLSRGPVFYWMSRDQRVEDNWALIYAAQMALEEERPLAVLFCLIPRFLDAAMRQYDFMVRGLKEVEKDLQKLNLPFLLICGNPEEEIPAIVEKYEVALLVTDFSPLKIVRGWKETLAKKVKIPIHEIDAHNIIPCWEATPKAEFAARTFRSKVGPVLHDFMTGFPEIAEHPYKMNEKLKAINWDQALASIKADQSVGRVKGLRPGPRAAQRLLDDFLVGKLANYDAKRNDPNADAQSGLSPYLHFGHIAPQRMVLNAIRVDMHSEGRAAFLEEAVIRRELADNFCFYNPDYDKVSGFHEWAGKTLDDHRSDPRQYLYSLAQFESGETHDLLWNAAQQEMMVTGKMHGYMRMYWAKKMLEWTASPEEALSTAIYLNDKYELDGRDPNGYAGIAWSIGGVHDRPWNERPIFGKVRYMNYEGCRRKFDVKAYIKKINSITG